MLCSQESGRERGQQGKTGKLIPKGKALKISCLIPSSFITGFHLVFRNHFCTVHICSLMTNLSTQFWLTIHTYIFRASLGQIYISYSCKSNVKASPTWPLCTLRIFSSKWHSNLQSAIHVWQIHAHRINMCFCSTDKHSGRCMYRLHVSSLPPSESKLKPVPISYMLVKISLRFYKDVFFFPWENLADTFLWGSNLWSLINCISKCHKPAIKVPCQVHHSPTSVVLEQSVNERFDGEVIFYQ